MVINPEALARQKIDELLEAAGWRVQNPDEIDLTAGRGVAVREVQLSTGPADYLLFVDRKVVGVIEAKKAGATLSGYELQAKRYSEGLPGHFKAPIKPLPFLYQSTSNEIRFTNGLDPMPRSRRVFAFHKPETLAEWMEQGTETLRYRFGQYPPLIETNLWSAQIEAIQKLEKSMADAKPRALIQMATGSGKTYTAVNYVYRMLKYGKVRRVLFLVDRSNLAKQALGEFQNFSTPDDGRKFTELYNVQRMTSNQLDDVSKVVITTIQRLYSMLRGEAEFDPELEEESAFENSSLSAGPPKDVSYNARIPIEYFDVIVVDECHRSIYNLWRQVLEYFDAFLIGMTATPGKQTIGFFNQNLVMEYTRQDAVLDGVNVGGEVYVIRTQITAQGSRIPSGFVVPKRDRKTRAERQELLDQDVVYNAPQLDQDVVSESQIRTIIQTFRDKLFTEIFPGRDNVPKTLIFAKDDSHAENIVHVVREEFNQGNDFCQKITYRVDGDPEQLINAFRNSYYPRVVVTVDMIATGTDVKPLEILLFMRQVKSAGLFEQMQGRGVRVINSTDLQLVTPDATEKTRFVMIDAVGVIDSEKIEVPTLERKKSVAFDKLLEQIAFGDLTDDTLISLSGRLGRLRKKLRLEDEAAIAQATGGRTLGEIAHALYDVTELDAQIAFAKQSTGSDNPTAEQIEAASAQLKQEAADVLTPTLRRLLNQIQARDEVVIDDISIDVVQQAGFDDSATERAKGIVQTFREFIEQNRDEITALQILYAIPHNGRHLQWAQIKELANRLEQPPLSLNPENLWDAYARVEPEKVKQAQAKRTLTDLVVLVRHALLPDTELIPYPEQVQTRYQAWLKAQADGGKRFTSAQQAWLDAIAQHIGVNLTIDLKDFDDGTFFERGGVMAAVRTFGDAATLRQMIDELNSTLAA